MNSPVGEGRKDERSVDDADVGPLHYVAGVTRQAGAIAWRAIDGDVQIVIVTSRRTGRWVFPKGGIDVGMTEPETAVTELYEEAGVVGTPSAVTIGTYRTAKIRPPLIWTIEIALYPVEITEVLNDWLESGQRERRFVTINEAEQLLAEPEMASIARNFVASRPGTTAGQP